MRDNLTKGDVDAIVSRLGYQESAQAAGFVLYENMEFPISPLQFDFSYQTISSGDFLAKLEYEGLNMDVVQAEIEALGM